MPARLIVLFWVVCVPAFPRAAFAQELRIYTRVFDQRSSSREPVARTLTLFHAGRVYDFIESASEVIVFEPMQNRFIVLNTRHRLWTTVHVDEIRQLLRSAYEVAREHERKLRQRGDAAAMSAADLLAFQLKPEFREEFDPDARRLSLISPRLRYISRYTPTELKEQSDAYRQYADGVCLLNFVLHPRVLFPEARLALNRHLAARQAIPVEVELQMDTHPRVHLRAEHRIHWSLDRKDRALIGLWNSLLQEKSIRQVTLREYQRSLGIGPLGKH